MNSKEAEQSAWVHFFNQALSDLTGMTDEYEDGGVKVEVMVGSKGLVDRAGVIADEAVGKLVSKGIPEKYWPTVPK